MVLQSAEKVSEEGLTPCLLEADDVDSTHGSHIHDGLHASVQGGDLASQTVRMRAHRVLLAEANFSAHPPPGPPQEDARGGRFQDVGQSSGPKRGGADALGSPGTGRCLAEPEFPLSGERGEGCPPCGVAET